MFRPRTFSASTVFVAAALALATPAAAETPLDGAGDIAYASGTTGECSGWSRFQISAGASTQTDTVEVTAGVDSNRSGQSWSWKLLHNGVRIGGGTATTKAPSGAFTVRRTTNNAVGPDTIRLLASNPSTGERCDGHVVLP